MNIETCLKVKIFPRASRNEISGTLDDGTVKIKISAPPVDGNANLELKKFLSKILDLSISNIEIVSGQSARVKLIRLKGISQELMHKKIDEKALAGIKKTST